MATPPAVAPAPIHITPATHTTRRGLATASFCLGIWSCLTFWWYPFGLMMGTAGLFLGVLSLAMGWRAGKDGENLAIYGVGYCCVCLGAATSAYRVVQFYFEGITPTLP